MWKALQAAARNDSRLGEYNLDQLINRAKEQYDRVENRRLDLAGILLSPPNKS